MDAPLAVDVVALGVVAGGDERYNSKADTTRAGGAGSSVLLCAEIGLCGVASMNLRFEHHDHGGSERAALWRLDETIGFRVGGRIRGPWIGAEGGITDELTVGEINPVVVVVGGTTVRPEEWPLAVVLGLRLRTGVPGRADSFWIPCGDRPVCGVQPAYGGATSLELSTGVRF